MTRARVQGDVDEDPDAADVARVLAGDPAAFEGIVRRRGPALFALAYRLCRDRGRAEDMTQEAFLKVFRSLRRWEGRSSFATWATSVALNAYRSHLRSRPWVARALEDEAAAAPGNADRRGEDERAERVRKIVAALPPRYRDALVLFYFAGRDLEQAASVLGVAVGTLKARLHRGRKLVERALAQEGSR
jgi:RNA polymerase sigma-70 factor (ECF subfamily)